MRAVARNPAGFAAALVLAATATVAHAQSPAATACHKNPESAALTASRAALAKDTSDLSALLALADALIQAGCNDDAVHALEEGEPLHPHNTQLEARIRYARSLVGEQHYFEGLASAEESAELERNRLRCSKLADIEACDHALGAKPDDKALLQAKGDALLAAHRPADALMVYRRTLALDQGNGAISGKIETAEAQRELLLTTCQLDSGDAALAACRTAYLPGASDEFAIDRRTAVLLQADSRPSEALDSFIAARLLKPDDQDIATAIVGLTDSTGRKDEPAVAARRAAQQTLRRLELPAVAHAEVRMAAAVPAAGSRHESGAGESRVHARAAPVAAAAQSAAQAAASYSNAAPSGRTN